MINMKLASIEKDKQPSQEILRLFEKTRVAYLSAIHDPKEYEVDGEKQLMLLLILTMNQIRLEKN